MPAGEFTEWGANILANGTSDIHLADFDGDGRLDILAVGSGGITVSYFDATGTATTPTSIPATLGSPGVGKLSSKGPEAFSFSTGLGLAVLLGQSGRTFESSFNTSLNLPPDTESIKIVPMHVKGLPGTADNIALVDRAGVTGSEIRYFGVDGEKRMFSLSKASKDVVTGILVGELKEGELSPCDEFVLGYWMDPKVRVYTSCYIDASTNKMALYENKSDGDIISDVLLESPVLGTEPKVAGRSFLLDINGDNHLDLLIGAVREDKMLSKTFAEMYVSYGTGAGKFQVEAIYGKARVYVSLELDLTGVDANDENQMKAALNKVLPLAVGDVNGDQIVDFVNSKGIFVSMKQPTPPTFFGKDDYRLAGQPTGTTWGSATIADFNGNGLLDVAAGSEASSGIDFFNGTGFGIFNPYKLTTAGGVANFVVGDFDGDLIRDLGFVDRMTQVSQGESKNALKIAFGRPFGAPEEPATMGTLRNIEQISSGILVTPLPGDESPYPADVVSDLFIVSREEAPPDAQGPAQFKIGLGFGSSTRRIQTPLLFISPPGSMNTGARLNTPVMSAMGRWLDPNKRGMIVFTTETGDASNLATSTRGWYAEASGEGSATTLSVASKALVFPDLSPLNQYSALLPVDLDKDGMDELLVTSIFAEEAGGQISEEHFRGGIGVAKLEKGAPGEAPVKLKDWTPHLDEPLSVFMNVRAGDLDGDSLPDVAGIRARYDDTIGDHVPQFVVAWNKGKGVIDAPVEIAMPNLLPYKFALVNVDSDPEKEVVLIAAEMDLELGELVLKLYELQMSSERAPGELKKLELMAGQAIAGGDVTGDGVDDLIIAGETTISVYKGGETFAGGVVQQ